MPFVYTLRIVCASVKFLSPVLLWFLCSLRTFFAALRPPLTPDGPNSRWALLAQSYRDAKAAAVEGTLPADSGARDPWGAPPGMKRRSSGGLAFGLKGLLSHPVTLKREVF